MLDLSQEDRELLKEAIGEDALRKIDKCKAERREIENDHTMGIMDVRDEECIDIDNLTSLITFHLTPIAAIARSIQIELSAGNYIAVDMLANDLRIRINELWDTADRWVDYEIEGRLSDMKKASEIPTTDTPEAKE